MATSLDRTTWYKHSGNPLFDRGEFGEWDSQGVRDPMAINDGTEFKLYYTGYDGSTYRIGLATSMDGLTWTRVPNNPVLSIGQPGEWDSMGIRHPFVFYDGDYYFMYYSGYAGIGAYGPGYSIGLAISTDGYNWEKQGIVLERADQYWFDNAGVSEPTGLLEPGIIKMWFVGKRTGRRRVGFAQSEPLFVDVTNYTPEVSPGDFLDFTVDVTNVSGDAVAYQLWSDATLPNGNPYSGNPVLGPQDLEVGPGETYTTNLSIFVPNQAPPNSGYALTTKVGGIYPRQIWDLTRFEFEILPLQ